MGKESIEGYVLSFPAQEKIFSEILTQLNIAKEYCNLELVDEAIQLQPQERVIYIGAIMKIIANLSYATSSIFTQLKNKSGAYDGDQINYLESYDSSINNETLKAITSEKLNELIKNSVRLFSRSMRLSELEHNAVKGCLAPNISEKSNV